MLTTPTTPGSQPTPALTRRRFSAECIRAPYKTRCEGPPLSAAPSPREAGRSPAPAGANAKLRQDFLLTHAVMQGRAEWDLPPRGRMRVRRRAEPDLSEDGIGSAIVNCYSRTPGFFAANLVAARASAPALLRDIFWNIRAAAPFSV